MSCFTRHSSPDVIAVWPSAYVSLSGRAVFVRCRRTAGPNSRAKRATVMTVGKRLLEYSEDISAKSYSNQRPLRTSLWDREVERHQRGVDRIRCLLHELGHKSG
jgi:hypothetical protein